MSSTQSETTKGYKLSSKEGNFIHNSSTQNVSESQVYDMAGWTFDQEKRPPLNLTFLAILALLVFLVCVFLKMYKWYRDGSKMKARGDVEFGDESEVNYGIITAGDKNFCHIDIRSDTTSVYDTVNSFRLMGNGTVMYAGGGGGHPYQDTVTSYKSLLMQRADGSQYDSVKSYKAFLQRVTQNKDIAVEVKLLENYPIRSKSAEHCFVVEEESSERSGDITTKLLNFLPLKKQLHAEDKNEKKPRYRQYSGDLPPVMRKRSASNPTCRRFARAGVANLSIIRHPMSSPVFSDSEEETEQSFKSDRKRMWAERKKMYRSTSAGKIAKEVGGLSCVEEVGKRRRHFSEDSARKSGKVSQSHKNTSVAAQCKKVREVLKETKQEADIETASKVKDSRVRGDESSSENPHSSHSSCDFDLPSEHVISESDDEDTKLNTASEKTLDNDVFYSIDSGTELGSSSELLQHSPLRLSHIPPGTIPPCIAEEQDGKKTEGVNTSSAQLSKSQPTVTETMVLNQNSNNTDSEHFFNNNTQQQIVHPHHSHSTENRNHSLRKPLSSGNPSANLNTLLPTKHLGSSTTTTDEDLSKDRQNISKDGGLRLSGVMSSDTQGQNHAQSPQRVKRFHVTFVNADTVNQQSE